MFFHSFSLLVKCLGAASSVPEITCEKMSVVVIFANAGKAEPQFACMFAFLNIYYLSPEYFPYNKIEVSSIIFD